MVARAGEGFRGHPARFGGPTWLSVEARKLLDEAGFQRAAIYASNELDETIIRSLKEEGARIPVHGGWGRSSSPARPTVRWAGCTSWGRSGRGRKRRGRGGRQLPEQAAKINIPGILQVRRVEDGAGRAVADVIYDEELGLPAGAVMVDPEDRTRRREVPAGAGGRRPPRAGLPAWSAGVPAPSLSEIWARTLSQLGLFHGGVKRFVNPHRFPVGLKRGLHDARTQLVLEARRAPR